MPEMSGYEVLRRIRGLERGRETPIIAVTASAFEENRQEALEAGADDFLGKPFREAELFAKLQTHLGLTYLYEDELPEAPPDRPLAKADLAGLPAALLTSLREAVLEADYQRILEGIAQIQATDGRIAGVMLGWAKTFEYQNLLDLLV
jgi:DNA-binding response OmpR family regulator